MSGPPSTCSTRSPSSTLSFWPHLFLQTPRFFRTFLDLSGFGSLRLACGTAIRSLCISISVWQGAHGHLDGVGQRRPTQAVVKTYLLGAPGCIIRRSWWPLSFFFSCKALMHRQSCAERRHLVAFPQFELAGFEGFLGGFSVITYIT